MDITQLPELDSGFTAPFPQDWLIYEIDGGSWVFATEFGPFCVVESEQKARDFWDAMEKAKAGDTYDLQELCGNDELKGGW